MMAVILLTLGALKDRKFLLLVILLSVVIFAVMPSVTDQIYQRWFEKGALYSRLKFADFALELFEEKPLLGHGVGGYVYYSGAGKSEAVKSTRGMGVMGDMVHNIYLRFNNISKDILKAKAVQLDKVFQQFMHTSEARMKDEKNRLATLFQSYKQASSNRYNMEKNRFETLADKVALLNPFIILKRGYSVSYKMPEERILKDSKQE